MKIIGHRGAAGLALENTLESINAATQAGTDAVEIDVRLTRDRQLVLSHDRTTGRVSTSDLSISDTELKDLQSIKLNNGEKILTLDQAIQAVDKTELVVEAKGAGWAEAMSKAVKNHSKGISVISFHHDELKKFHRICPEIPVYALERSSPFDVIHTARNEKLTGIDINFWILNPITYLLARWAGLEVIVYTVNSLWIARLLKTLYPNISITTNHPDKLGTLKRR